ncbi:cobalamin B12-binding domain-containing protein [Streptomyces sp. NPDC051214]|uniref:cobalamin B12-binding domain-containing protein n=1 Tax=Streptomyces sp. NPDC051214 TaxID=3155282 RepID=UPI003413CBE4
MELLRPELRVLVTGTASDSHTWNLVYLQLALEEWGHQVTNLGPCVRADLLAAVCRSSAPDLVVISSVNGHGYRDGLAHVTRIRAANGPSKNVPIVIGGKLCLGGSPDPHWAAQLRQAGCARVFDDGDVDALRIFVAALAHEVGAAGEQFTAREAA